MCRQRNPKCAPALGPLCPALPGSRMEAAAAARPLRAMLLPAQEQLQRQLQAVHRLPKPRPQLQPHRLLPRPMQQPGESGHNGSSLAHHGTRTTRRSTPYRRSSSMQALNKVSNRRSRRRSRHCPSVQSSSVRAANGRVARMQTRPRTPSRARQLRAVPNRRSQRLCLAARQQKPRRRQVAAADATGAELQLLEGRPQLRLGAQQKRQQREQLPRRVPQGKIAGVADLGQQAQQSPKLDVVACTMMRQAMYMYNSTAFCTGTSCSSMCWVGTVATRPYQTKPM